MSQKFDRPEIGHDADDDKLDFSRSSPPKLELDPETRKGISTAAVAARRGCEENPQFHTQEFVDAVSSRKPYVEKYEDEELAGLLDEFRRGKSELKPPYLYAVARAWQDRNPEETVQ